MALVQENSGRELHGVMERNGSYARISLADVEKEMTADQKAEARKLARELFAKIEANKAGKKN